MKAYSTDLRERIIKAVDADMPATVVARTFSVSVSTVRLYMAHQRKRDSLKPRTSTGRTPLIGSENYPALTAQLEAAPDATLAEHCQKWEQTHGVKIGITGMHRTIRRLGWTRKKR